MKTVQIHVNDLEPSQPGACWLVWDGPDGCSSAVPDAFASTCRDAIFSADVQEGGLNLSLPPEVLYHLRVATRLPNGNVSFDSVSQELLNA